MLLRVLDYFGWLGDIEEGLIYIFFEKGENFLVQNDFKRVFKG